MLEKRGGGQSKISQLTFHFGSPSGQIHLILTLLAQISKCQYIYSILAEAKVKIPSLNINQIDKSLIFEFFQRYQQEDWLCN